MERGELVSIAVLPFFVVSNCSHCLKNESLFAISPLLELFRLVDGRSSLLCDSV